MPEVMPFTIASLVSFEEDIKKSRFQAFATPVENEQDVKDFLEAYRDPSTTHQCWAWKIGHQVRFTNLGHFTNVVFNGNPESIVTFTAPDQRIEYGVLLGYRIIQRNNSSGFTIDIYGSAGMGYRNVNVDDVSATYFQNVNQDKLVTSFSFGLNVGNVFSYR